MANNAYVQTFDVEHMPASIPIGRETETGVRELRFDVSAWLKRWPEMEIAILPTAPGTAVKYPASVRMEGTVAVWEISGSDTTGSGTGSVEIEGRSDGRRVVSASAAVIVFARTPGTEGDVPDYARPWVDEVLDAADRAKEAADRAEAAGGASDEAIGKAVAEYLTENPVEVTETDPTVPGWAKQANKPVYTAEEVGAQPAGDYVTGSGLEKAVDDALTKAKESGEFKGEPGKNGAGMDVTGASVGQIVQIAAVDDNGVPSAWIPVDMPAGEQWEIIGEVTVAEEVKTIEFSGLNHKKILMLAEVRGTATNKGNTNALCKINNETFYYPGVVVGEGITRWCSMYVEIISDVKRHFSAVLNNNAFQSTSTMTGSFGNGTPIQSVEIDNWDAYRMGSGTHVKVYGVKT